MKRMHWHLAVMLCLVGGMLALLAPHFGSAQGTPEPVASPAAADLISIGENIYNTTCIACHQAGGAGVKGVPGSAPTYNGAIPALANSPFEQLKDPTVVIQTVLGGRAGMPAFAGSFTDEQIAGVISYVRQSFGNKADPVTPDQVKQVRAQMVVTPVPATPIPPETPEVPQGLGN